MRHVASRDFLGHSKDAIQWQIWTALLTYVLLRYLAFVGRWSHSFTRLFALIRSSLWNRFDLPALLRGYGIAGGSFRLLAAPHPSLSARLRATLSRAGPRAVG